MLWGVCHIRHWTIEQEQTEEFSVESDACIWMQLPQYTCSSYCFWMEQVCRSDASVADEATQSIEECSFCRRTNTGKVTEFNGCLFLLEWRNAKQWLRPFNSADQYIGWWKSILKLWQMICRWSASVHEKKNYKLSKKKGWLSVWSKHSQHPTCELISNKLSYTHMRHVMVCLWQAHRDANRPQKSYAE